MRQGNDQVVAWRRFLAVLAVPFIVAAVTASGTAYAQRFQGGAGSPDPGMGGTTGSPGIGDTGPLGGGATAGVGAGAGAGAGPAASAAPADTGAGTPAAPALPRYRSRPSPGAGNTTLSPLPPPALSGAAPLGGGPSSFSSSSGLGGTSGSSGLGGTPTGLGSSGTSGFGGSSSLRNDTPTLGGSQPPSNPSCGTLTAATSCANGH